MRPRSATPQVTLPYYALCAGREGTSPSSGSGTRPRSPTASRNCLVHLLRRKSITPELNPARHGSNHHHMQQECSGGVPAGALPGSAARSLPKQHSNRGPVHSDTAHGQSSGPVCVLADAASTRRGINYRALGVFLSGCANPGLWGLPASALPARSSASLPQATRSLPPKVWKGISNVGSTIIASESIHMYHSAVGNSCAGALFKQAAQLPHIALYV